MWLVSAVEKLKTLCTFSLDLLVESRKGLTLPPVGVGLSPLYLWILWFLWKACNLLIFEDRLCTEEDTIHKAIKEAGSWQEAKLHAPPKKKIQKLVDSAAVHQDALLCFSDAAWKSDTNMCGLGWIIENPLKVSLFQGSSSRPYVSSVLVAETLALKAAINVALAQGVSRLACFSDCQELMLLLNADGHANELDGLLEDIKLLKTKFTSISFHFVPRIENVMADSLAKSALLSCNVSSFTGV
ncbi:unnamed protein product [Arabidopsis lyrata]|nr:unnamed protein product [Arabidopsis lyrata]